MSEALACIRCGACLNACPVFREIGGHGYLGRDGDLAPYPGPIGSVISPGLFGSDNYGHLAQASTLCGACKDACPVDINLPELLLRIRAGELASISKIKKPGRGHRNTGHPEAWVENIPELQRSIQAYTGSGNGWLVISAKCFPRRASISGFRSGRDGVSAKTCQSSKRVRSGYAGRVSLRKSLNLHRRSYCWRKHSQLIRR